MTWPWSRPEEESPEAEPSEARPTVQAMRAVLARIEDPELGLDIVSLGIVRDISVDHGLVRLSLAPTSPSCPVGPWMADQAREALLERFPTLDEVLVELTWDPPWTPDDMSAEARQALGFH